MENFLMKAMVGILAWAVCILAMAPLGAGAKDAAHTFAFGGPGNSEFLLDGKPFQIRSGEMHPDRIPPQYWRHRIRMARAMGLNTVAIYIFWNAHEPTEGHYDFSSPARDIGRFLRIAREEGMWVLLRPGPYCCGEWDFGGIPSYLLRYPDLKLRTLADPHYVKAVASYIHELATVIHPNLVANGGPILMVQIENEYGSYPRRDHDYVVWLRDLWIKDGVPGPFYTADGAGEGFLRGVTLPGAAVGLDTGQNENDWAVARKMNPGVPVFSSEVYPGWLRHWGEGNWAPGNVTGLIKFYMDNNKSFNLYMFDGGTNFGFTAGANSGGPGGYQPDLTSYDYGAPVNEQGRATPAYYALRKQLASYLPAGQALPPVPAPIPTMAIPEIKMERWASLWNLLPAPLTADQPAFFESMGQNQGLMIYRTRIPAGGARKLTFQNLHDYGQVFLDGAFIGTLDRRLGQHEITLPTCATQATLEILVEAMGHINFTIAMESDRKGIYGDVGLGGTPVKNWQVFPLPLTDAWAMKLPQTAPAAGRPGGLFQGHFTLRATADTFLDMSGWQKGVVWVNGHNLGRFWSIGPQQRLYCPAPWLRVGANDIVVLDLIQTNPAPIAGLRSADGVANPLEGLTIRASDTTPFDIDVPANTVRTRDIPCPTAATVVAAHLSPMQDEAMAWGVGLALGWADGTYVQINARSDGRWGIRHNGEESLAGGCPPGGSSTVAIKLTGANVQLLAKPDGSDEWALLAQFPRADCPGPPATIRIGKIGGAWKPQDWTVKGPTSPCRVDWVTIY
jgi:beta-galactosidase